ncbi:hypothetical protein [Lentimicrobium sp.]|mgnify:CR=1 FL=1|uniref:hypothetical protein n=1 Tax=Lentimicrobium sp. TaxID=2034841 RepID=UPI002BE254EB|nr:hypothetical protein [Lentimicrobium sp.]HOP12983.1 hypothetical protein [Lentimicrobium sp.]HPR26370.1 hypothetical protein [Lentimicrobium sp.]
MLRAASFIAIIHIRRTLRIVAALGLFRAIFLLMLIIFGFISTLRPGMLPLQAALILSLIAQAHLTRKDHNLLTSLSLNKPAFFIIIYSLITSPFLLLYLFLRDFNAFLILAGGLVLVALFNKPVNFRKRKLHISFPFIPADAWEWRAGLKNIWWVLILTWVVLVSFHRHYFLFAGSIIVFSLVAAGFQMYHESLSMIRALGLNSRQFLIRKIYLQLLLFLAIVAPAMISSMIIHPEGNTAMLMVILNSLLVQAFAVSIKYAGYRQGQHTQYQMSVIFLLNIAFAIPVLLPLPLFMLAIYLRRADLQLKTVLYA